MSDDGAFPAEFEGLAGQVRDLAYRQARPRLSGEEVRRHALRRRRNRRGAAVGGGVLSVAGVCVAVLLTMGHGPAGGMVRPPGGYPLPTTVVSPEPQPSGPSPTASSAPGTAGGTPTPEASDVPTPSPSSQGSTASGAPSPIETPLP